MVSTKKWQLRYQVQADEWRRCHEQNHAGIDAAEEVFTLREKLDAMVTLHDQGRRPTASELDTLDTDAIFEARRQVFVERFLEPLNELLKRESTDT